MYIVQSPVAALILMILGKTVADAMYDVVSIAHFLTALEEDTAVLNFPSARHRRQSGS